MKVRIELDPQMDEPEMDHSGSSIDGGCRPLATVDLGAKNDALDLLQGSKRVLCRCVRDSLL